MNERNASGSSLAVSHHRTQPSPRALPLQSRPQSTQETCPLRTITRQQEAASCSHTSHARGSEMLPLKESQVKTKHH